MQRNGDDKEYDERDRNQLLNPQQEPFLAWNFFSVRETGKRFNGID